MDKLQQLRTLVRKRHDENWEKRNNGSGGNLYWERALEDAYILAIIDSIPRFKVGDVIKSGSYTYTIEDIDEDAYILDGDKVLTFNAQYDWELVEESQRMISAKAKEAGYSKSANEDLEEEIQRHLKDCLDVKFPTTDIESIKKDVEFTARYFAKWQKEQFEKNRLAACDTQTPEEAEREMNFATNIIEKEHRTPTYDDAIKYGMRLQKEEMMKDAINAEVAVPVYEGKDIKLTQLVTTDVKLNVGDKVKLILIKSEQP